MCPQEAPKTTRAIAHRTCTAQERVIAAGSVPPERNVAVPASLPGGVPPVERRQLPHDVARRPEGGRAVLAAPRPLRMLLCQVFSRVPRPAQHPQLRPDDLWRSDSRPRLQGCGHLTWTVIVCSSWSSHSSSHPFPLRDCSSLHPADLHWFSTDLAHDELLQTGAGGEMTKQVANLSMTLTGSAPASRVPVSSGPRALGARQPGSNIWTPGLHTP